MSVSRIRYETKVLCSSTFQAHSPCQVQRSSFASCPPDLPEDTRSLTGASQTHMRSRARGTHATHDLARLHGICDRCLQRNSEQMSPPAQTSFCLVKPSIHLPEQRRWDRSSIALSWPRRAWWHLDGVIRFQSRRRSNHR